MISNTTFAFQSPLLKHSNCVASFEGTKGAKSENVSPVCTKTMVKNEKIRVLLQLGAVLLTERFVCRANKLAVVRTT